MQTGFMADDEQGVREKFQSLYFDVEALLTLTSYLRTESGEESSSSKHLLKCLSKTKAEKK